MKNWLFTLAFAAITITFVCCNQQDNLLPADDLVETSSADNIIIPAASPDDVTTFTKASGDDETSTDQKERQVYCIYEITSFDADCDEFTIGQWLCIDCPNGGNGSCPGVFRKKTKWEYVDEDGKVICSGTWEQGDPNNYCRGCVRYGKKGLEFVD